MVRKNTISILVALVIIALSFTGASTFNKLHLPPIPYLDKMVHFIMYFTFMSALIFENRLLLTSLRKYLALSVIPLFFGGLIEILQSLFTTSRTGDIRDLCANAAGIAVAICAGIIISRFAGSRAK